MDIKKVNGKLVLGLSPEKKAEKEKTAKPLLAFKEMQQYLIQQGFKPKYKL